MIKIEFTIDPATEEDVRLQVLEQFRRHFTVFGFNCDFNTADITNADDSICNDEEPICAPIEEAEPELAEKPKRKRRTKVELEAVQPEVTLEAVEPVETLDPFDALDEIRETADKEPTLTHDDLRKAVGKYAQANGLVNAQKEIPALLGCAVVDVKDEDICFAIEKIEAAIDKPKVRRVATKDDVMQAIKAYASKYDGQDTDLQSAEYTRKDIAAILEKLFGDPRLKMIPDKAEDYGRTVEEITKAVKLNTFKREVK